LQTSVIAALKTLPGSFHHFFTRYVRPIEGMPVFARELTDEFALRSAVPIPKWVDRVQFAQIVGSSICEESLICTVEISILLQFLTGFVEGRNDMLAQPEKMSAFRNLDRSKFPCPRIDVLKNVMVNGLNMPRIERAGKGLMFKLADAPYGRFRFKIRLTYPDRGCREDS
jgi:hypothetical protein